MVSREGRIPILKSAIPVWLYRMSDEEGRRRRRGRREDAFDEGTQPAQPWAHVIATCCPVFIPQGLVGSGWRGTEKKKAQFQFDCIGWVMKKEEGRRKRRGRRKKEEDKGEEEERKQLTERWTHVIGTWSSVSTPQWPVGGRSKGCRNKKSAIPVWLYWIALKRKVVLKRKDSGGRRSSCAEEVAEGRRWRKHVI